jgi:hypothetical protein
MRSRNLIVVIVGGIALAGCGGGSSGGGSTGSPPSPPVTSSSISIADRSIPEGQVGNTTASIPVTLSPAAASAVTVRYATQDGTARAGTDYQSLTGTLTFAPGETSKQIAVLVIGNTVVEPDRQLSVVLSDPSGATLARSTATITITNDDVAAGTVVISPDQVVMFQGDRRTVAATVRDAGGRLVSGRPITWSSNNSAVALVDGAGQLTAAGVGRAVVTAEVDGQRGTASVTVTPPATSYVDFKQHFPYRATSGSFVVASDIGGDFSQQHLAHLLKVWQHFTGIFATPPGAYTEMYYTRDLNGLYTKILSTCPTIVIPGGRNLTACFDNSSGVYVWFVVPYVEPDFGTQLHEIAHTFLYFTQTATADWPWFNEGLSMYWESGEFNAQEQYTVNRPLPYLTSNFRRVFNAGALLPLPTLMGLSRNQFYGATDPAAVYSQSGMVLYYVFQQYPTVGAELLRRINTRTITTNQGVIDYILQGTGLSLTSLEANVRTYALSF